MAGSRVKSAVGCSNANGRTARRADIDRASWLMAAPPASKFATIWAVTAAGNDETPCTVTP